MGHPEKHRDRITGSSGGGTGPRPARSLMAAGAAAACVAAGVVAGHAVPSGGHPTTATEAAVTSAPADRGVVDINTLIGPTGAASGTGMLLTSGGEVLTNYHLIAGATSITAVDPGTGGVYPASVVGYSPAADVAVLSLAGASGLPPAVLGDSNGVRPGAAVTAFGNAMGMGGTPSVAAGTVTALNQAITAADPQGGSPEHLTGLIGTSAALQPGDSGGPLVDAAGAVIGMDTALVQHPPYGAAPTAGYAIPIDTARAVAAQLVASHTSPGAGPHAGAAPGSGALNNLAAAASLRKDRSGASQSRSGRPSGR